MNESGKLSHPDQHDFSESESGDDAVIGRAFRRSMIVVLIVGVVLGGYLLWTKWNVPEDKTVAEIFAPPPEIREPSPIEIPEVRFTDVTQEAGITFVHENGASGDKLLPETMGGGCAFFDYDNDGDPDILFVNSKRWPWDQRTASKPATLALYQNDGSGHFKDVTTGSGLDLSMYGQGAAVGDYDNDSNVDVFLSTVGSNRLFRNLGNGQFVDVSKTSGIAGSETAWSTSCGWFDFDNDGDLDLFVCNYVAWSKDNDLVQNFQLTGGGRAYGRPQDFRGTFPYLYRNEGNGNFTDISEVAGVRVRNNATGEPLAKSLGVTFDDLDRDGRLEIVVANDTVQNLLFLNQKNGTFLEMGVGSGMGLDSNGFVQGSMGIDSSRFRNNQEIGIAIGNFANEMTALYVARDGLSFTDEAVSNGLGPVTRQELTFGLFFFDSDLDGRLDLFAANGHLEEDINKVQKSQHYEQPPQLLWNCGLETEFLSVPAEKCGEDLVKRIVGRGTSYADIDGDGDLDILIASVGRAPRLLRNDQHLAHHWLRFKLTGSKSNADAIGAIVEVTLNEETILTQQVMPTRSYLSQVELPVTFGLGTETKVKSIRILWPSGKTMELSDLPIDRLHQIDEESGLR